MVRRFTFQQRHGKIDWRRVAEVDLDAVIEHTDTEALHTIAHESNCLLAALDEKTFFEQIPLAKEFLPVKLIQLMQLLVEHLLHQNAQLEFAMHGEIFCLSSDFRSVCE